MRNLKKIVLIGFILINLNAVEFGLKNISIDEISSSKQWKQLLYFNEESEIKDKKYFLSETGNLDPKAELLATINAYKEDSGNNDPVCLFPARYYFLSKYISFPKYKKINDGCTDLKKWQPIKNTDSISLVLVSGYISNPASTFGHSLIKLNNKESGLFDTSINYGALVPDNENTIKYIYKGLTGGYEAGFSDKYFYEQDLMYSNKEYRDMWEYKLNLTPEQKDLILLHLYEILTRKFDYYFLSKNCGYRVSEILNLVSDEESVNQDLWYLPVETFDFLETKEKKLIKNIKYIPSNKKVFDFYFEKLTEKEKLGVKEFIRNNVLIDLNEEEKIHVLDFLLIYYKNTLNIITVSNSNIGLDVINVEETQHSDIYYSKLTNKKVRDLVKKIKKSKKGLSIFYGDKGTGKTSMIKNISKDINKDIFFIPNNLIDQVVLNPEFINFIKKNNECILVFDDFELAIDNSRYNPIVNNIIQMVDSLISDFLNNFYFSN